MKKEETQENICKWIWGLRLLEFYPPAWALHLPRGCQQGFGCDGRSQGTQNGSVESLPLLVTGTKLASLRWVAWDETGVQRPWTLSAAGLAPSKKEAHFRYQHSNPRRGRWLFF